VSSNAAPRPQDPAGIVTSFLVALQNNEIDAAMELLAPDAIWINVSLPAVRGRDRIERICRLGPRTGTEFRVHFHNIATHGNVVLTERTDALGRGRFEQRFWVYGRFELVDGRIKVWRDSFDWLDLLVSLVRATAGALVPALNRPWPGDRTTPS
jgi:limonene-1,2-epoxide hydrolase